MLHAFAVDPSIAPIYFALDSSLLLALPWHTVHTEGGSGTRRTSAKSSRPELSKDDETSGKQDSLIDEDGYSSFRSAVLALALLPSVRLQYVTCVCSAVVDIHVR